MTNKQQTIVTTVIGAVITCICTIITAVKTEWAPIVVGVGGALNEMLNIITKLFVKEEK